MAQPSTVELIRQELNRIPDSNPNTFDFTPPQSQFTGNNHPIIDLNDLVRPPNFNECSSLARQADGSLKHLNDEQLENLRKTGEFSVLSEAFPSQKHTWKVTKLLQKGTSKTLDSFYDDLSVGCHQMIICIPNRIYNGDFITLKSSVTNMFEGLVDIPILLFGWNTKHKKNSSYMIKEKLNNFTLDKLVEGVILNTNIPADSFVIQSISDIQINLILDKRNLILEKLTPYYEAFKVAWENNKLARRSALNRELFNADLTVEENNLRVITQENILYQQDIFDMITNNLDLVDAVPLINLIKSVNIYRKHINEYEAQKAAELKLYLDELRSRHAILARISDWIDKKSQQFLDTWTINHPMETVYTKISNDLQGQEKYIFDFNRAIKQSPEYKAKKEELENATEPGKVFVFKFRIWNPKNWKIAEDNGHYTVDKYNTVQNSSSYPGWRMTNILLNAAKYIANSNHYLLVNLLKGKFGLRSLIGLDEFYTGVDVDYNTGTLKNVMKNSTWFGRIRDLWQNISDSRDQFESAPETGFLGKSFTRIFNLLWNYGVKGIIGTTLCLVGHPILVILNTLLSGIASLTSPLWGPLLSIIRYLFTVLIYDLDSPDEEKVVIVPLFYDLLYKFLIKGIGQAILSIGAIIAHGVGGLAVFIWALISNGIRYAYDGMVYHLILRWRAKLPIDDGFLIRRISGPGMSNNYFHLITYNLALVMIQYQLEKLEFEAYENQIKHRIDAPMENLLHFYSQFQDVAMRPDESKPPIKTFHTTKKELNDRLNNIIREHWTNYNIKNYINSREKIKLARQDLAIVLERGTDMCRRYVTETIFQRLTPNERASFWTSKQLAINDFVGLTKYCLQSQFSSSILVPLEDTDNNGFHLDVQEVHVNDFIRDLFDGNPSDGLNVREVNPVMLNKLMSAANTVLLHNEVFDSKEQTEMTIDKRRIQKHIDNVNKTNENLKKKTIGYGTMEPI